MMGFFWRTLCQVTGTDVSENATSSMPNLLQLPAHWKGINIPSTILPKAPLMTPVKDIQDVNEPSQITNVQGQQEPTNNRTEPSNRHTEYSQDTPEDSLMSAVALEHHRNVSALHEHFCINKIKFINNFWHIKT